MKLQYVTELQFISEPFPTATEISGALTGIVNVIAQQERFRLRRDGLRSDARRHAVPSRRIPCSVRSFTRDPTRRQLLTPGKQASLPFETTVVSRRVAAGQPPARALRRQQESRRADQLTVQAAMSAMNRLRMRGEPLRIELGNDSHLDVPVESMNQGRTARGPDLRCERTSVCARIHVNCIATHRHEPSLSSAAADYKETG